MNNNIRKLIVGKADLSELNTLIKLGIIKLAEAVMETGNAKYICNFACYMVHQ